MMISKILILKLFLAVVLVGCSSVNDYCENPAPLSGNPDNSDSGFVVQLNDNIDFTLEVDRLTRKYEFEVTYASESLNLFVVLILNNTMEKMRCEESVYSIFIIDPSISPPVAPPLTPPPPSLPGGGAGGGM